MSILHNIVSIGGWGSEASAGVRRGVSHRELSCQLKVAAPYNASIRHEQPPPYLLYSAFDRFTIPAHAEKSGFSPPEGGKTQSVLVVARCVLLFSVQLAFFVSGSLSSVLPQAA